MKNPSQGELDPNWEGPYRVTSVTETGAYQLEDWDGIVIPRPRNVNNLRKFYFQLEFL